MVSMIPQVTLSSILAPLLLADTSRESQSPYISPWLLLLTSLQWALELLRFFLYSEVGQSSHSLFFPGPCHQSIGCPYYSRWSSLSHHKFPGTSLSSYPSDTQGHRPNSLKNVFPTFHSTRGDGLGFIWSSHFSNCWAWVTCPPLFLRTFLSNVSPHLLVVGEWDKAHHTDSSHSCSLHLISSSLQPAISGQRIKGGMWWGVIDWGEIHTTTCRWWERAIHTRMALFRIQDA